MMKMEEKSAKNEENQKILYKSSFRQHTISGLPVFMSFQEISKFVRSIRQLSSITKSRRKNCDQSDFPFLFRQIFVFHRRIQRKLWKMQKSVFPRKKLHKNYKKEKSIISMNFIEKKSCGGKSHSFSEFSNFFRVFIFILLRE